MILEAFSSLNDSVILSPPGKQRLSLGCFCSRQSCFLQEGEAALGETRMLVTGQSCFWVIQGCMNSVLGLHFAPNLRLFCGLPGTEGDQEVVLLTLPTALWLLAGAEDQLCVLSSPPLPFHAPQGWRFLQQRGRGRPPALPRGLSAGQ